MPRARLFAARLGKVLPANIDQNSWLWERATVSQNEKVSADSARALELVSMQRANFPLPMKLSFSGS